MGRSYTPKYRVEYTDNNPKARNQTFSVYKSMGWNGVATVAKLEDWRKSMNDSFKPGGCNDLVSREYIYQIVNCRLVNQTTNDVVAEVKAPMFEVM